MKTLQDQRMDISHLISYIWNPSAAGVILNDPQSVACERRVDWEWHSGHQTWLDSPGTNFFLAGRISELLLVDFRFPVGSTMWSTPSASVRCRVNQRVEAQQVGPCLQLTWVTPERPWRVPIFLRDQRITTYQTWLAWIAGSNPFCQLIEIRTLGCPEF